jgi:hypothetical protein
MTSKPTLNDFAPGTKINYLGDACNQPASGVVTSAAFDGWYETVFMTMEDGALMDTPVNNFSGPGRRFEIAA